MYKIIDEFSVPESKEESKRLFSLLVSLLRPSGKKNKNESAEKLSAFIADLQQDEQGRNHFQRHLKCIFDHYFIGDLLVKSGIPKSSSITTEIFARIGHRILPEIQADDDFRVLIDEVFRQKNDYKWVENIPNALWMEFFNLLDFNGIIDPESRRNRLIKSILMLSYKISAQGFDEVLMNLSDEEELISPFAEQNKECVSFIEFLQENPQADANGKAAQFIVMLNQCSALIQKKFKQQFKYGAGISYTIKLNRLQIEVERLKFLIAFFDRQQSPKPDEVAELFKSIVYYENTGDSFLSFLNDNINTLSYRISIHKSETGEHYITNNRKEYFKFFKSACGGGFFAGMMAILKLMIHHLHLPLFQQHFIYSLNYATGFVGIQATHTTLATKQPAMTASALAGELDKKKNAKEKFNEISIIIAKVWRSQFVAFAGNLLIAFPFAYLLAFVYHMVTGHKIAEGAEAQLLLDEQNFTRYPVIIYASFTGFFLFLSGIISGYFDNNVQFRKIPERLENHPLLIRLFGKAKAKKIGAYSRHNLGGLAGNVFLGFFLGFAGFFGKIFGLPFDIRHITISTGHFAIGAYGLDNQVGIFDLINTVIGIILIGFMNFSVSFGLAFYVALRARRVKFFDYRKILSTTLRYFLKHPFDFIYPPKNERKL